MSADRLLAVYKESGTVKSGVSWSATGLAGTQTGTTNSCGEIWVEGTQKLTLTVPNLVIEGLVSDEDPAVIDLTNLYDEESME